MLGRCGGKWGMGGWRVPGSLHSCSKIVVSEALLDVSGLLEEKGLARADVEAILGGNARRVLRNGWR